MQPCNNNNQQANKSTSQQATSNNNNNNNNKQQELLCGVDYTTHNGTVQHNLKRTKREKLILLVPFLSPAVTRDTIIFSVCLALEVTNTNGD